MRVVVSGALLMMLAVTACGPPFHDYFAGSVDGGLRVEKLDVEHPSPPPYRIQNGDQLAIRFYRNPELNNDVTVRPDGMISLPLIDDVPASGITPKALGDDLETRYKTELAVPDVTVIVTKFGGQRVFIGGEVNTPSEQELVSGLTAYSALMKAGGLKNPARLSQVILIRRGPEGKPLGTSLDLTTVEAGTHPDQDVSLEPFDIVVVPKSTVGNVNLFVELYITRNLPAGGVWLNFLNGAF